MFLLQGSHLIKAIFKYKCGADHSNEKEENLSAAVQLAYVTFRLRNISPTQHFAYKAKRLIWLDQRQKHSRKDVTCEVFEHFDKC
uniref:FERM domain-containing protein n=1 Tax=Globodera rostochiensis TaxID=31243 RepID=A0A914GQV2_GLORO